MLPKLTSAVATLLVASVAYAWDFRDEVYTCGTQGMTLAELQSAGVTLVSHCSWQRAWLEEAARYGIRGMPYISLYKVYDLEAPGAERNHPFWSAVAMNQHPEWVYIGPDGQRKRPFNNEFYPPAFWQSCTNTAGIAEAYADGAAAVMREGAGGVFIDNVLPAAKCWGPEYGLHQHLYPDQDNVYSFQIALRRVQDTVHSFGPDSVVMLNIGHPFERWAPFGDCIMLESFIYNIDVRPGPGGWVGNRRVQVKQWPQILDWIRQTAPMVDGGGNVVALEYLPDDPEAAFFSYAADKLANFLWTGSSDVRRDVCRTLYRCRLQRACGPLTETDGVWWRHYPNGMVALNPTGERVSVRVEVPPTMKGLAGLADARTDELLPIRRGLVRLTLNPGQGGVYVAPQALAEGHLREALVAVNSAVDVAAPDATVAPPELAAALAAVREAHQALVGATDPTTARTQTAAALRTLDACLVQGSVPDVTARLAAGASLSRDQVQALIASGAGDQPAADIDRNRPQITAGGVTWTVGQSHLLSARGMGLDVGVSVPDLHPTHGWLRAGAVTASTLTVDEPGRKVMRLTATLAGSKTSEVVAGLVLELELEARAADPMLSVTATVRNTGDTARAVYFLMNSQGAGTWFSAPGQPAQEGGDYLQVPHAEWTFVSSGPDGCPGLLVVSDQPLSYSRYCLHLYTEPRSGPLEPGQGRTIALRVAPVAGAWQRNPRACGPVHRALIYLSRAWSLTAAGKGLPEPSTLSDAIAGMPELVQLCPACGVLHGVNLALRDVALLDANGASIVPCQIEHGQGWVMFTTRPSLREDLFYQLVARVTGTDEDLPLAIVKDYRPGPSVTLALAGEETPWQGDRGVVRCNISNRLDSAVTCSLTVQAPEGYQAPAPQRLTLGPGETQQVAVAITTAQRAAPPGEVTLKLTLPEVPGSGELARTAAFRPAVVCPTISPPTLDGRLDDPAWQQAAELPAFGLVKDGAPPQEATRAWVGRDATHLYVAFECQDSRMEALMAKLQPAPGQNDPAVHGDDSVEVFLDPPGELPYLQLVANALGARKTRGDARWEVATWRGPDRWTVEMRIETASLGLPIAPGAHWGANFCRVHQRTGQASCWSPTGGSFHQPDRFGVLIFP